MTLSLGGGLRPRIRRLRERLVLRIAATRVHAAHATDGRIVWRDSEPIVVTDGVTQPRERALAAALTSLLARRPQGPRVSLIVSLDPTAAQTRLLSGLPPMESRLLAACIQERVDRYFVVGPMPPTVGSLCVSDHGVWATAFDPLVIATVVACCAALHARTAGFVSAALLRHRAVSAATPDGHASWNEAGLRTEIRWDARGLAMLRCAPVAFTTAADGVDPSLAADVEPASDDDKFVEADIAATIPENDAVIFWPMQAVTRQRRDLRRVWLAAGACATATLLALCAPGLAARRAQALQAASTRAHVGELAVAAQREERLAAMAADLQSIRRFAHDRRSATAFLASLTDALPDSTSIESLRFDETAGTLVALSPQGAAVASQAEAVPMIEGAQVLGAVARQSGVVDGASRPAEPALERANVEFRWRIQSPTAQRSPLLSVRQVP